MIVYSNTKRNFINQCRADNDGHTIENAVASAMCLAGITYFDESQRKAWRNSLPSMADILERTNIDDNIIIAIEYNIRQAKDRLDFVITGKDVNNNRSIIIVELKQWSTASASSLENHVYVNVAHGIMDDKWHPSYQAKNYANIISNTYEVVQEEHINIYACSYLHNMPSQFAGLMKDSNRFPLINEAPCFLKDDMDSFIDFITRYISSKDESLLIDLDNSRVVSSRQLSDMLLNALHGNPFYSYDEAQARAVATIKATVADCLRYGDNRTIIIKGGPGTGKSVVALNVLGELTKPVRGRRTGYNAFYCTVNAAPRYLYAEELIQGDFTRNQLGQFFKFPTVFKNTGRNEIACVLFDEAHRLFDSDYMNTTNNILEKAISSSRVSVFFIDEDQIVTKKDYATIEKIKEVSDRLDKRIIEGDDLVLSTQFRVLGGDIYMSFIKSFLGYNDMNLHYVGNQNYDFRVFDSVLEMHELIKEKDMQERIQKSTETGKPVDKLSGCCRLVAGYCYEWLPKYGGSQGLFRTDTTTYDIRFDDGFKAKWNLRCPEVGDKYSWLNDPESINEVGCIHTCQGLDLKYCGVIIGKDLQYRNGQLLFNQSANAQSDSLSGIKNADAALAEKLIRNTYNVLLTRGMKGTYVYCEDEGLREYLKSLINQ